ncbi:MAG: serine/threonine protein kinase, partial [Deltaproteobacteria bacterium]
MTSTATDPASANTGRAGNERFSETVAPVWRLHVLLIGAIGIGLAGVWALDRPGRPTGIAVAALVAQAALFAATIRALRRPRAGVRRWPYALCVALSALTAVVAYFFGPNSGFAGVVALVVVLARLFTGGWGVRSGRALAWTIYGSLAGCQAALVALVVTGTIPDASLVPLLGDGHGPAVAVAAHAAIQAVWLAAFFLGRLLQDTYGDLAARALEASRDALRRQALLAEVRAEYERALVAGGRGVFSGHRLGNYSLGPLIARGGVGEIYEAREVESGRRAAVKVLRGDRLGNREVVDRFLREADVLRRIDSPHVARVYEVGGVDGAVPYIAMELLGGRDLAATVAASGPLDPAQLVQLARDVAAGLEAVHAAGLVHGDLTPRNVVLASAGGWKLVDFGLAAAAGDAGAGVTAATVPFAAPERLRGAPANAGTDIYAFAAVLYTAVTGRPPFDAGTSAATIAAVAETMPPSPMELAQVHRDVAAVLRIGLDKSPAMRFASASALADALCAAVVGTLDPAARALAEALERALPWAPADHVATSIRLAADGPGATTIVDEDCAPTAVAHGPARPDGERGRAALAGAAPSATAPATPRALAPALA